MVIGSILITGKEFISSLHFNLFQLMCYDKKKKHCKSFELLKDFIARISCNLKLTI